MVSATDSAHAGAEVTLNTYPNGLFPQSVKPDWLLGNFGGKRSGSHPESLLGSRCDFRSRTAAASLVRRIGRSADVQMAQIPKRGFIFLAHAAREVRIAQMLIARRLRHILQHRQPVLDRPLPVRRHLLPPGEHLILDVRLLLLSHALPHFGAPPHVVLLLRRQLFEASLILLQPLALFR
jgi:hypothetical protein